MPAFKLNVTLLCTLEEKFVTIQISHWSRSMTTKFSSVEKDWHGLAALALKALERAVKEEGGYSVYLGLLYYCLEGPVHKGPSQYINYGINDMPNSLDDFVQAFYASGGEVSQFLHPNSPYFAQDP